jgi:hypothetical protein
MMLTIEQLDAAFEPFHAATLQHGTIYFDAALNPVVPTVGQWFTEYFLREDNVVMEGDIVKIADVNEDHLQGVLAMVSSEGEEGCHASRADILILQY